MDGELFCLPSTTYLYSTLFYDAALGRSVVTCASTQADVLRNCIDAEVRTRAQLQRLRASSACQYYKYEIGVRLCVSNAEKYLPSGQVVANCADHGMLLNDAAKARQCITYAECAGYVRWNVGGEDRCVEYCANRLADSYAALNGSVWQCGAQCFQYAADSLNKTRRCRACTTAEIRVGRECLTACPEVDRQFHDADLQQCVARCKDSQYVLDEAGVERCVTSCAEGASYYVLDEQHMRRCAPDAAACPAGLLPSVDITYNVRCVAACTEIAQSAPKYDADARRCRAACPGGSYEYEAGGVPICAQVCPEGLNAF